MKPLLCYLLPALLVLATVLHADDKKPEPITPKDGPMILFNGKDLSGLHTWVKDSGRDDPKKVFTVHDGMIHVSGEANGYAATDKEYQDYHLIVEYKWGQKTDGVKF